MEKTNQSTLTKLDRSDDVDLFTSVEIIDTIFCKDTKYLPQL